MKKVNKKSKKSSKKVLNKLTEVVNENGVIKIQAVQDLNPENTEPLKGLVLNDKGFITVAPPSDENEVLISTCKKVITFDLNKNQNGYLIELFKAKNGRFTTVYLSATAPGGFKGYHLHKVREANYVCVKGKIKIILYTKQGREEHVLSADGGERLHIPNNIPTGLSNEWKEEAWIINFPSPAYDPELKGEQLDFTEEECERGEFPGAGKRVKWGTGK